MRKMRRHDKLMDEARVLEILEQADYGSLAVLGDEDYPYAVPVNFVYFEKALYIHCANSGHKLDAIEKHPKVGFTIVMSDKVIPEELNTHFESVVLFGKASIVQDDDKVRTLRALGMKYSYEHKEVVESGIAKEMPQTTMIKIEINHMSGKCAK